MTVRKRLEAAVAGNPIEHPVLAVYDWFIRNRPIDWPWLFEQGLGQINHACLLDYEYKNAEIVESTREQDGQIRRDVRWITDRGELHEWYLGEWRQEYLIKTAEDYGILTRALSDTRFTLNQNDFLHSEQMVGEGGITIGQLGTRALENRNAMQAVQIDAAGLERFSVDLALQQPELLELLELMDDRTVEKFRCVLPAEATHIKLWENLSIETMGPKHFCERLVPVYRKIFALLDGSGKRLQVHYDGKLQAIAGEISGLPFDGLDSFTGPPEGDLSPAEARELWPDLFLWFHPNLGWYALPEAQLEQRIAAALHDLGPRRYCLLISEEVAPQWRRGIPRILEILSRLDTFDSR